MVLKIKELPIEERPYEKLANYGVESLSNEEFNNNVTQFDLLINATTSEKEILTIEKVVLANYEEIIKKNI